ncbi:MAG TPA: hypothetical protein VGD26_00655 [Chitinophagaceae bacterium]
MSNLTIPGGNSPADAQEAPNNPQRRNDEQQPKEGDIRKVDKETFDDDYESKEEAKIASDEANSEKANNT